MGYPVDLANYYLAIILKQKRYMPYLNPIKEKSKLQRSVTEKENQGR